MGVEELSAINALDDFAECLPPEHRANLYKVADTFLHIGAEIGVRKGNPLSWFLSKDNRLEEYSEYLNGKTR